MGYDINMEQRTLDGRGFISGEYQGFFVAILSGFLVIESGIFLTIQPATEFETSLVGALPVIFWVLFYAITAGSILILIGAAVTGSPFWKHGLVVLLANYAFFFFLPQARGYRFNGRGTADALQHIGDVKAILATGALPGIWYPAEHVLMAEMTMLGIPLIVIPYVTAFLFTSLQITGIGVLVRTLSGRRGSLAAGLAAGSALIYTKFHLTNHPAVNSFMLVPVLLSFAELYRRNNDKKYLTLLLVLTISIVYFHPLTLMFVSGVLMVTAIYSAVFSRTNIDNSRILNLRIAIIPLPLLFAWLINFGQTRNHIKQLVASQNEVTPGAEELNRAGVVDLTPTQILEKFITLYGSTTIYYAIAGIFTLATIYYFIRRAKRYEWGLGSTHFLVGLGIGTTFLATNLIVKGIIRANRYALLFAAVVVGIALTESISNNRSYITGALAILILLTAGLGANAAYSPNQHMTYAEYDGSQYMTTHDTQGRPIYSVDTRHTMEAYVLGTNSPRYYPESLQAEYAIPRQLGYNDSSPTATDTFGESYVVTKTHDTKQHTAQYFTPQQQDYLFRYGQNSLDRLHNDPTANKVYTNGGFTGWEVTAR